MKNYNVVSEKQKVLDPHNTACVSLVILLQMGENRYLYKSLLDELFWFFNHFNRHVLFLLMIEHLQHLTKRATIDRWNYLVTIGNMLSNRIFIKLGHVFLFVKWSFLNRNVFGLEILVIFLVGIRIFILDYSSFALSLAVDHFLLFLMNFLP